MTNLKYEWEAILESVSSSESPTVGSDGHVHCHQWQWDGFNKLARVCSKMGRGELGIFTTSHKFQKKHAHLLG